MAQRQPLDVEALYERHAAGLLVFFTRRTFDPQVATDLWAETFAQAVASSGRFRGGGADAEAAWLYRIAHRQLSRYWRKGAVQRRAQQRLELERPQLSEEAGAELIREAGLADLRADLATAMAALSEETRLAVELRVVHELSYGEVATRLATSEQNARARVSRGLRALGELLDDNAAMEVA
ncbi:MAG: RNA polymerase sigma factor [Baekduia sp.]